MRNLEDQIYALADEAVAATDPIEFRPSPAGRTRGRYILAAAASLLVVVGAIAFVTRPESSTLATDGADAADSAITNPLDIDLAELAESSDHLRESAIGEVLSFDFDALPQEWRVDRVFAGTLDAFDGPKASYWQRVEVVLPEGIHLVVNVEGHLDQSEIELNPLDYAEQTEVRGQPAQTTISSITWIEQGIARVSIVSRGSRQIDDELVMLAEALRPVTQRLSWGFSIEPGEPVDDQIEPLLAGTLNDIGWEVIATSAGPDLLTLVIEGTEQGRTPHTTPANPAEVEIGITSLPGGFVIFGHAPPQAKGLLLRTKSGTVSLPLVQHPAGRAAFAAPIADAIDPIHLDFLDDDGQSLGVFLLEHYPAYLYGVGGTGVELSIAEIVS